LITKLLFLKVTATGTVLFKLLIMFRYITGSFLAVSIFNLLILIMVHVLLCDNKSGAGWAQMGMHPTAAAVSPARLGGAWGKKVSNVTGRRSGVRVGCATGRATLAFPAG
jgi:hypothetical protein